MKTTLKFLYYLQGSAVDLIETKRLDKAADAPPGEVYKWLCYFKDSGKVVEFDFQSMKSSPYQENREFIHASVTFDQQKGELKLFEEYHDLINLSVKEISQTTQSAIANYYDELPLGYRHLKFSDYNQFSLWICDEEVIRYSLTKFHQINSKQEIQAWFLSMLSDKNSFALGLVDRGQLIGYAGIAGINRVDQNGEYFILIGEKNYWGKGIATQVTNDMVQIGFNRLKLHRIFLTASSANEGALKAYSRAGFSEEGRMKEAFFRNNNYSDKVIMGLLKESV